MEFQYRMARNRSPKTARFQLIALVLAAAIAAVLYVMLPESGNRAARRGADAPALSALAVGAMANFVPARTPLDLEEVRFTDGAGRTMTLADFAGRTVLLNLWATWCAPCREEMPALDRLQGELGGDSFTVVALSLDRGALEGPRAFFEEIGVRHLALYHDGSGRAGAKLGAFGLPTTLLIGPDGRSLGRLVGPADWDSPEALELLRAAIGAQPLSAARGAAARVAAPDGGA